METPTFGTRELLKALKKLGFIIDKSKGKGSHAKAIYPTRRPKKPQPPFIMIQYWHGDYYKSFREDLVKEIESFGFSREEIIKVLR
ncbi:MAG: hypothetical protein A2172_02320 [Candidatus Woykebacteria bacterium RBG_13_40_15]|uniref:Addiction module toxin, HicA family n=1 Tax=Candidatus Woykebacteria bacterium RBG_13_40_15 TaxID=1802593 RepID=A0A1G1W6D8_9BACT|nr:MAG: hypothetical protein A2172_02320 [Candidatus Woykebacteria bacterium RBG_13_40_15]